MIGFLKGKLAYRTRDSVLIDVQGVGYQVRLSERHLNNLDLRPGEPIELTTHLLPREDALELYGFSSPQEKEIFLQLTRVSGIGPRTALAIFSALELQDVIRAVVSNQPKVLSQAPGIGAKTAQRIILELKEKVFATSDGSEKNVRTKDADIIISALQNLGYSSREAKEAVKDLPQDLTNDDQRLRWVLKNIAR